MTTIFVIVTSLAMWDGLAQFGAFAEPLPGADAAPWYDSKVDGLKRIDVSPPDPLEERVNRWTSQPWNITWPTWIRTVLEALAWLVAVGLIVLVAYALIRAFTGHGWGMAQLLAAQVPPPDKDHETRIESLPFDLKRPLGSLFEAAKRCAEAGDYNQAIIYLYSYLLTELDRIQIIRLAKGKTNRQYLRETQRRPTIFRILRTCMVAFEDVFFGEQELGAERFEQSWKLTEEFQRELELITL